MDAFPSSLPNAETTGYVMTPADANVRTDMDSGPARIRRTFTSIPTRLTLRWRFSASEIKAFRTFYHTTTSEGSETFTMDVYADDAFQSQNCRFAGPYSQRFVGPDDWQVDAQVDITDSISNA